MPAIAWFISNGMHVMENAQPWKIFHYHAMIMEKLSFYVNHEKSAMIFLQDGFDHYQLKKSRGLLVKFLWVDLHNCLS